MKLRKKKEKEEEKKSVEKSKDEKLNDGEKKEKKLKTPAEGSRYASLVMLIVSVLISLGFYLWGVFTTKGVNFSFGKMENTWEYEK